MAGATQLTIYNGALGAMGEPPLLSLTENRQARRTLDDVWYRNGVLTCLAAAIWNFAARTVQWDYNQDFTPPFGYQCAYELPADWVRTKMVCEDAYFQVPMTRYAIEDGFLFTDLSEIFVSYVSNDTRFGMNLGEWPDNFCRYVEMYFADKTVATIARSQYWIAKVAKDLDMWSKKAKATDAMDEATKFLPPGTWSQARHGLRTGSNYDMGNPNMLIGT